MVLSLIFRIVRIALASLVVVYFGWALAIAALTGTRLAAGPRPDAAALLLFIAIVVLGFELVDWRRREGG
jgi:hypothetical protein